MWIQGFERFKKIDINTTGSFFLIVVSYFLIQMYSYMYTQLYLMNPFNLIKKI